MSAYGEALLRDGVENRSTAFTQRAAIQTATAAATKVFELNLARIEKPGNIPAWIHAHLYRPEYALEPQGSDDAIGAV